MPFTRLLSFLILSVLLGPGLGGCGGAAAPVAPLAEAPAPALATVTSSARRAAVSAPTHPTVALENTGTVDQQGAPLTFAQVFAPGHFKPSQGQVLLGSLEDGANLPLQVDIKASHIDGSVRHAIVSTLAPALAAGARRTLVLTPTVAAAPAPLATAPAQLLEAGFSAAVEIDLDGQRYTASPVEQLRAGRFKTWLNGPVAAEWPW